MTPSHSDAGNQCTVGSVGDARMETQIGLYKTELISPEAPWRSLADGELATAEAVTRSTYAAPPVTGAEGDESACRPGSFLGSGMSCSDSRPRGVTCSFHS